jgi:hypothetical protein
MNVNLRLSLFPVAVVFAAFALHLTQSESSAAFAQQHNQTDLEFTRERAQVNAVERRIDALEQRLAAVVAETDQASAREHVLLGRDPPPPRRSGASNTAQTRDENTESESVRRIPSTIRHRDRTITAADQKALRSRLEAAEQTTRSLGERVNRPDFGAGLRALDQDLTQIEAEISSFE